MVVVVTNSSILSSAPAEPEPKEETNESQKDDDASIVDKRYTGSHIPSRVFRVLQKAVGEDTPTSGGKT